MITSVAELAFLCMSAEKDDRPCMMEVVTQLNRIKQVGYGCLNCRNGPHGPRHGVREQIDLSMALEGPSFLLLSQTCPVSSTSLHHYRPGLASEKALAP
jgi:hypothetical protein